MKILVVEDQAMFRELLVFWVAKCSLAPAAIEQAEDGVAALRHCRAFRPDIILLDLELPDVDGLDLLAEIRQIDPQIKVVALSSHTYEYTVHRVIETHLHGFVDKNSQLMTAIPLAIDAVRSGRQYLSPSVKRIAENLRQDPLAFYKVLSKREIEILSLIGRSLSNDEVGAQLGLSPVTVQNHRARIMSRLGIRGTPQLVQYAIEKGFTRVRAPTLAVR